jgi:shikimate kinase
MRLYIIGMPASGKSLLGKQLALSLNLRYIDLDIQLEKTEGCYIRDIISNKGHQYFREKERDCLHTILNEQHIVVSCGGGTPMFFDNIDKMKKSGIVIWLNADLSLISKRIKQNITRRPLFSELNDKEIDAKVRELYQEREKKYKLSDIKIFINERSKNTLSSVIQQVVKFNKRKFL